MLGAMGRASSRTTPNSHRNTASVRRSRASAQPLLARAGSLCGTRSTSGRLGRRGSRIARHCGRRLAHAVVDPLQTSNTEMNRTLEGSRAHWQALTCTSRVPLRIVETMNEYMTMGSLTSCDDVKMRAADPAKFMKSVATASSPVLP